MVTRRDFSDRTLQRLWGLLPPDEFESDGCTCAPDSIGAVDLRPACLVHDWAYHLGGNEDDRLEADRTFYKNLRVCGLSRRRAHWYYYRVRFWGTKHFQYISPTMRPRGWRRLWLIFTRYLQW